MLIKDLADQSGVTAETIRYYESIGLLPAPKRTANNYRHYAAPDTERLRFIASARALGLSLTDIGEILAVRDRGIAPCEHVLAALDNSLVDVDRRLKDLVALRDSLVRLRREGASLPKDDVQGDGCVCHLIKNNRELKPARVGHVGAACG